MNCAACSRSRKDASSFAERLVDGRGHALDEHSVERWMAGDGEAFLKPGGLDVNSDSPTLPVKRIDASNWQDTFGFVARPGGGKVT